MPLERYLLKNMNIGLLNPQREIQLADIKSDPKLHGFLFTIYTVIKERLLEHKHMWAPMMFHFLLENFDAFNKFSHNNNIATTNYV